MIRFLSIVIAVLAAVIAYLTDTPLLYIGAAALIVVAVAASLGSRRSQYRRDRKADEVTTSRMTARPDDELSSLGISNIRPKTKSREEGERAEDPADSKEGAPPSTGSALRSRYEQERGATTPSLFDPSKTAGGAGDAGSAPRREFEQILLPYLQSLQAATGAHSALLLEVDPNADQFRVAGVASKSGYIRRRARFPRSTHFLSRLKGEDPVYVLPVGGDELKAEDLGYYSEPLAINTLHVAPVRTGAGIAGYLVLDTLSDDPPVAPSSHEIIAEFASLLGRIMELRQIAPRKIVSKEAEVRPGKERPRRDIIAEEISVARNEQKGLALALVLIDDAEGLGNQDPATVESAEQALATYLKQETSKGRIERFGELMYGVFHHGDTERIEDWAHRIQHNFIRGDGAPARGRLSIGVAVLSDRHQTPDDLRNDATDALREAYETGDCIIIE